MPYPISILVQAKRDVRSIARWLATRSPKGAANWLTAFEDALERLSEDPQSYPIAPERLRVAFEIRQILRCLCSTPPLPTFQVRLVRYVVFGVFAYFVYEKSCSFVPTGYGENTKIPL